MLVTFYLVQHQTFGQILSQVLNKIDGGTWTVCQFKLLKVSELDKI